MVYQPTIPQSTDRPSDSQQDLLNNFGQINTQFSVNHTALTASSNNGYHTQIQFPTGIADPNKTSPITSLYTKLVGSAYELFFQNGATSSDVAQLTGVTFTSAANAGTAGGTIYTINTPWKLTLYAGVTTALASASTKTVTFPVAYSTLITGIASPSDPTNVHAQQVSCTPSTTGLTLVVGNSGVVVYYFAIGKL